ncbi:hypothetical protein PFISCL1PPCAC_1241, partial [Pristionchus fissidentatus]
SASISCSSRISVMTYYAAFILSGVLAFVSTLLPLSRSWAINENGKWNLEKATLEYGGVYRDTIRYQAGSSNSFTWCTPVGNGSFYNAPSDLPSVIRYIEFYCYIGVYMKVPLIAGLLYRLFMILAEEREAIYVGKTGNSLLGCIRVVTHIFECLSFYFFIGMHQDYDRS